MTKSLNRLKVVLAEQRKTNKWLAEQLGKDVTTVSKWCTNRAPNEVNGDCSGFNNCIAYLVEIAVLFDIII